MLPPWLQNRLRVLNRSFLWTPPLNQLWEAVQVCKGCDLYRNATQAVLGEGPSTARIVMVGEQPGDKEDLAGRPFVGRAGALLNRALEEAGINHAEIYITNAVKHFKFDERGKRHIHKRPRKEKSTRFGCLGFESAELPSMRPSLSLPGFARGFESGSSLMAASGEALTARRCGRPLPLEAPQHVLH